MLGKKCVETVGQQPRYMAVTSDPVELPHHKKMPKGYLTLFLLLESIKKLDPSIRNSRKIHKSNDRKLLIIFHKYLFLKNYL